MSVATPSNPAAQAAAGINSPDKAGDKPAELAFRDFKIGELWVLHYNGPNARCQKGFRFVGSLREAVERARKHCEIMGFRFIFVAPMISDLQEDEINKIKTAP